MHHERLPGSIDAAVFVDGVETAYTRMGDGPIVIVLASDPAQRTALGRLFATRHRVILPHPPGPPGHADPSAVDWLSGFLDGLGMEHADIVTDEEWAAAVDTLVSSQPDRARRVEPPLLNRRSRRP